MKACLLFALTLPIATGCTSSYYVADEPGWHTYSFAQMNENARNKSFTISTVHGEEIDATGLFVGGDSTSFLEPTSQNRITMASSSVGTITIDNVGAGAIDGAIFGVLAGIPIGLLLGKFAGDLESKNPDAFDWAVFAGSVGVAGVLGAGMGAIIGHTDEYIFQSTNRNSQKEK